MGAQSIAARPAPSWLRRLGTVAADPVRLLSLIEQALVSGANFLALLVMARHFAADQFGLFSYAYIAMLFVINLHRSLVVVPFVIHTADPEAMRREGRLWRQLNGLAGLAGLAILMLVAAATDRLGGQRWMAEAFAAAAVFVPFAFQYEFVRRWVIQQGRYCRSVAAAATYGVVYLVGLAIAIEKQSLLIAVGAFIAGNLAAALVCLPVVIATPEDRNGEAFEQFAARLGKFLSWSLLANLAYNGYYHMPGLLLGAIAGPGPVGAFQALRTLIQPLITIGTAIDNFDKPRAARALARDGLVGLRRALSRTTLSLVALSAPYMLLLAFVGPTFIEWFYGDQYDGQAWVIWLWLAVACVQIAAYPFETALFVLRRPDVLTKSRLWASLSGLVITGGGVAAFGLPGAMAGLIVGIGMSALFASNSLKRVFP